MMMVGICTITRKSMPKKKRTHNYPTKRADTGPRPNAGRPAQLDNAMRIGPFWVSQEAAAWLKEQPDTMSETIRRLIAAAIEN